MNINPTMPMTFGAKLPVTNITRLELPGKNVQKVCVEVEGEIGKKITSLKYKAGEVEKLFQNKKGFSDERFAEIIENVQTVIKDGVDFLFEFIKAQRKFL